MGVVGFARPRPSHTPPGSSACPIFEAADFSVSTGPVEELRSAR
jgi:hypothetical protein